MSGNPIVSNGPQCVAVSKGDLVEALLKHGGENAKRVAESPRELDLLFGVLRDYASLLGVTGNLYQGKWSDAANDALGLANRKTQGAGVSRETKQSMQAGSFVVSQTHLSYGLRILKSATPGKAVSFIGATFVTKAGLAVGLFGDDKSKARCVGALMELGGATGTTAMTGWTGVGGVLGLVAMFGAGLDVYDKCLADGISSGAAAPSM